MSSLLAPVLEERDREKEKEKEKDFIKQREKRLYSITEEEECIENPLHSNGTYSNV
jgi:hypothetical protein